MSNNAGRFDGQTAWRLAPATGRASETTYRGLTFCVSFPILLRFGPETDGPRERPRFASGPPARLAFPLGVGGEIKKDGEDENENEIEFEDGEGIEENTDNRDDNEDNDNEDNEHGQDEQVGKDEGRTGGGGGSGRRQCFSRH